MFDATSAEGKNLIDNKRTRAHAHTYIHTYISAQVDSSSESPK